MRRLRKLCLALAVISGVTMIAGFIICARTNRLSDAFDSTPVDLNNPGNAVLYEDRYCKLETTRALPAIVNIEADDSAKLSGYRYYAVYVSDNPKRFVLIRVEEKDFPKYEKLVSGETTESFRVRGRVRPLSDGVKGTLQVLTDSLKEMDTSGRQDYDTLFLDVYLEPVEPKDYSGVMSLGLWMVVVGLVLCGTGIGAIWYFEHRKMMSRVVTAGELERRRRR